MSLKTPVRLLTLLSALGVAAMGAFLLEESRQFYTHELSVIQRNLDAQATLLAEHAQLTFSTANRVLMDIEWQKSRERMQEYLASQPLYQRILSTPQFSALIVTDAQGEALFTAKKQPMVLNDLADTLFFQSHRQGSYEIIGHPLLAGDDQRLIPVSHRLGSDAGEFLGIAVILLDPRYFQDFYNEVSRELNLRIGMFHRDGTPLSVYPRVASGTELPTSQAGLSALFRSHEAETLVIASPLDGSKRIAAYRSLKQLPITVTASYEYDRFLASLYPVFFRNAGIFLVFAIGAIIATVHFNRDRKALEALNQKLDHLASTDSLLGISNRRELDHRLDIEWHRARRQQQSLGLLLIDVDHFKRYNDAYGHPAGDACLKRIAAILGEVIKRPGDLVARYGGEEMAILLPATEIAGARHVAERVHALLGERRIPFAESPVADHVTVSIGTACMTPVAGHAATELIKQADHALYTAKNRGRNRTEIAPVEEAELQ